MRPVHEAEGGQVGAAEVILGGAEEPLGVGIVVGVADDGVQKSVRPQRTLWSP